MPYKPVSHPDRPCAYCEEVFTPKTKRSKFCGKKCANGWAYHKKPKCLASTQDKISAASAERRKRICKNCGQEFIKPNSGGGTGECCSYECSYEYQKRRTEAKGFELKQQKVCTECGTVHTRLRFTCSDECGYERSKRIQREAYGPQPLRTVACKECGKHFRTGRSGHHYCTRACAKKARKRRRKRANGTVATTAWGFAEVYNAHDGNCNHCGVHCPIDLRGTCEPTAPECDHIIPLALGGSHDKQNIQLLCRQCNGSKGADLPRKDAELTMRRLEIAAGVSDKENWCAWMPREYGVALNRVSTPPTQG